jgi:hypothetical protein
MALAHDLLEYINCAEFLINLGAQVGMAFIGANDHDLCSVDMSSPFYLDKKGKDC